jgi:hypothetical protein
LICDTLLVKVLQRNVMLWDILCSTYSNVIPGISVFIGHASKSPYRIQIQLNATKCGINIILIYLTLIINFNYSICKYRTLEKYSNAFYKNKQNINPACPCHIYLINSTILLHLFIFKLYIYRCQPINLIDILIPMVYWHWGQFSSMEYWPPYWKLTPPLW